jgi:acyl-CoA synthetase (AMP-forming)/AMP-acid ligase II
MVDLSLSEHRTYLAAFHEAVQARADRPLLTFLADGTGEGVTWSYGDLYRQASRVARDLLAAVEPGSRVLLLAPPGLDYVAGFFGCLYAGMLAVPAYPPSPLHGRDGVERLLAVANDSESAVGLTMRDAVPAASQIPVRGKQIPWLALDGNPSDPEQVEASLPDGLAPSDIAFLQYTSGSTGDPKGVMVTQGNLAANCSMIGDIYNGEPGSCLVSWLPPYHDMGLIGMLLTPPLLSMRTVFMPPTVFLRRPVRWLQALSAFHGRYAGAPNFAYEACAAKVSDEEIADLDLSTWEVAISGAEPVRASTIDAFSTRFAPAGFRKGAFSPSFGLAEVTLMATAGHLGANSSVLDVDPAELADGKLVRAESGIRLVTSGKAPAGTSVRICEPDDGAELPHGTVGEIVVTGPHVTAGYWGRPDATAERFPGGSVRTGDLGAILDDQLIVTGRLKDLLILRGRNVYPHDIELTAEASHVALRRGCAAAFSVDAADQERLVVVLEVAPNAEASHDDIAAVIRRTITEAHGVAPEAILLSRPGTVPKTSSGKVRRSEARRLFETGALPCLFAWLSAAVELARPVSSEADVPAST